MGNQAVIATGVLSRDGDVFETHYEIRRFQIGKSAFCAWCGPQRGEPPTDHHDLADGTLRCRLKPGDYDGEVDRFVSSDVEPLEGEGVERFEFHRQGFYVGTEASHWDYQLGSLFHLVLPPYHLPVPEVESIEPQPTYGWRIGDRFAMGWQGSLIQGCWLRFRRVAPEEFAEQSDPIGRRIKSLSREERIPDSLVEVDPQGPGTGSLPAREYDLGAIHDLLTRAFMNEKDLRRFLRHRKAFQPVLGLVGVDAGLAAHVDVLVEYCETRLLFDELLAAIRAENPRQYERLAFQFGLPAARQPAVAEREEPSARRPAGVEVTPPSVIRPINLSFDGPTEGSVPSGWFNSLGYVGGVSTAYEIRVVPRPEADRGACVLFQNPKATAEQFGSLMQRCPADYLAGKVVRFEGEVATQGVEQWAGLWFRADGADMEMLFFDNMYKRRIRGTTPWTTYAIDAQLPPQTAWMNYGIMLSGRGTMWADNFRLLVWESGAWREV